MSDLANVDIRSLDLPLPCHRAGARTTYVSDIKFIDRERPGLSPIQRISPTVLCNQTNSFSDLTHSLVIKSKPTQAPQVPDSRRS